MNITSKTQVLAVVGNPVRHSLSPKLHNYLSHKLELDYVYTAFEPDSFDDVSKAIKTLGIKGINVTAPFKYKAYECVDELDEEARLCGSVNTIVNTGGVLKGYSTDGEGLYMSMKLNNIDVEGRTVLLLGAGGAAKPVCVMLKRRGAKAVIIKNRTESKSVSLCDDLNKSMNTDIFSVYKDQKKWDIIINTTSVGLGTDENPLTDNTFYKCAQVAVDLIYHPAKTSFLSLAEENGLKILNGAGMLVFQGVLAYEYFTGVKVPENIYEEVLELIYE